MAASDNLEFAIDGRETILRCKHPLGIATSAVQAADFFQLESRITPSRCRRCRRNLSQRKHYQFESSKSAQMAQVDDA
jgi:hypothetical protein